MASPGFVVRGKGQTESLASASHGAGRVMSRTKAMQSFTWSAVKKLLAERDVTLLSAGLDEVPGVYKDIDAGDGRADRPGRRPRPLRSEAREDVPERRARGRLNACDCLRSGTLSLA